MSSKLKLSKEATQQLDFLSLKLNLRKNIICKVALCVSLNDDSQIVIEMDQSGQEFNKSTILGLDEVYLMAMVVDHAGQAIDPEEFFNVYVRAHIIRGLKTMNALFIKINSPIDFISRLCNFSGEEIFCM